MFNLFNEVVLLINVCFVQLYSFDCSYGVEISCPFNFGILQNLGHKQCLSLLLKMQHEFCLKFISLSNNKSILKIGRDLAKLVQKFLSAIFEMRHGIVTRAFSYDCKCMQSICIAHQLDYSLLEIIKRKGNCYVSVNFYCSEHYSFQQSNGLFKCLINLTL